MKTTVVKKSPVVVHLASYFVKCAQSGEMATYDGLKQAAGGEEILSNRANIYRALAHVRENNGYVFRCIPNQGYQPLQDNEISEASTHLGTYRIGRAMLRWKSELKCVDITRLQGNQEFMDYSLASLKLSVFEQAVQDSSNSQIAEKAEAYQKSIAQIAEQRQVLRHLT